MGSAYEQPDGDGGRDRLDGIGVQLTGDTTEQDLSEAEEETASALSLPELPTVNEQRRALEERQAARYAGEIAIPSDVVDEILRQGSNRERGQLRLIYNFMAEKTPEEYTEFVKQEYRTGGRGIEVNGQEYSAWWDELGMQIAVGHTVADRVLDKAFLSWEDVSGRIQQLLNQGEYAPQVVLDAARANAVSEHAQALFFMERDLAEGVSELVFEDSSVFRGGYPDVVERLSGLLEQPEFLTVCQQFGIDTSDYSFPYIASWSSSKDMKELRSSMDTIRHTAAEMIDQITETVQNLQREQVLYTSVELFGTPALFDIGRIKDEDIPAGLYRYEMRGSDYDPAVPVTVEKNVAVNHAASILTAYPIPLPEQGFLRLGEELNIGKEGMITVQDYRQITAGLSFSDMEQRMQNAVICANEGLLFSGNEEQYAIYQLDRMGPGKDYFFMNLDYVKSHDITVKGSNYKLAYGGVLQPTETLETLYEKFNIDRPEDFKGHSLSVSDVVFLKHGGEAKAHYVDSVGFVELPDFVRERRALWEQQWRQVTELTDSIELDGHEGTWHTVGQTELMGETIYLMEHNEFGSDVAKVAVNAKGDVVAEDLWNGFDEDFHEAAAAYFAEKGVTYERPEQIAPKGTEAVEIPPTDNATSAVYMQTPAYAREHGELEQYRQSRSANVACKTAIEQAISNNFDGKHLKDGALKPVLEQFSADRIAYVLASTLRLKDWDRRFSQPNKEWAASVPIGEEISPYGNDRRLEWSVNSHPAVLDGFVGMFRQEAVEQSRENEKMVDKETSKEKELTADEITNFKEISREYYPHLRTAEYVFSCDVRGEPDVLTYEVSQHDDGESYSLHTKNHDIWDRMSRKELEKLDRVMDREVTFAAWKKEIEQADSGDALRDVEYGMMDTENLNLSDAQRERLYEMMEEKGKSFLEDHWEERVPDSQGDDRNPFEEIKITTVDQNPEETPAETEQTAEITFYVAECMEFPVLGEYHEDIGSLQEAMALYEQIPAERMNGIKGIGFTLNDGSTYDGMSYELMSAGIVDRDLAEEIPYFKENPLVQNALAELEAVYCSPHHAEQTLESGEAGKVEAPAGAQRTLEVENGNTEQINSDVGGAVAAISENHMGHTDKAVTVSGRREDPAARASGSRKESVLQALRERQAKLKGRETEKPAQKTQNRRKGEQEL